MSLPMQIASKTGVTVVMDCGGVEDPIDGELLQNVTVLSPNETELARLTGNHRSLSIVASRLSNFFIKLQNAVAGHSFLNC